MKKEALVLVLKKTLAKNNIWKLCALFTPENAQILQVSAAANITCDEMLTTFRNAIAGNNINLIVDIFTIGNTINFKAYGKTAMDDIKAKAEIHRKAAKKTELYIMAKLKQNI